MTVNEVIDGFYLRKVAVLEDQNAAFRADMVDSQHWKQEYVESLRWVAELETALRAVEFPHRCDKPDCPHCAICGGGPGRVLLHEDTCIVGNAFRHTEPGSR